MINLRSRSKPQIQFCIACFAVIFISIGSVRYVLQSNYQQLLINDAHIFDVRVKNLSSHVSLIKTNLLTLKTSITNNIILARNNQLLIQDPTRLVTDDKGTRHTRDDPLRTLLIYRTPGKQSSELRQQLTASRALLPTLQQVLKNIPNSLWIYYVSKSGFSFVSPEIPSIPSEEYTYSSIFWTQTIPENNPNLKMVVTDAYEDYFSKELVITITVPVTLEGEFIGVIGFDLGINALLEINERHISVGKTFILDNHNSLIHPDKSLFDQQQITNFDSAHNPTRSGFQKTGDLYWQRVAIFDDELYAVHRIDSSALLTQSIKEGMAELTAITATALILILFLFRLRDYGNKITELSNSDPLTGLLNRRSMKEISCFQISMCHRNDRPVSLVILDIDHFKKINDNFGHDVGDQVLKKFAVALQSKTRANDLICRYGGEEFIICLPEIDEQSAADIIRRFQTITIKTGPSDTITVTFSAGVTKINPGETLEKATRKADQALLRAKQLGRNRIEIYSACSPTEEKEKTIASIYPSAYS